MSEIIDLATWLAGASIAIGLIQWAKGLLPKTPTWVWSAALPVGAIAAALAAGGDRWAWDALGIWAIAQVGWDAILRRIIKGIEGKAGGTP